MRELLSSVQSLRAVTEEKEDICAKYAKANERLLEMDDVVNQLSTTAADLYAAREEAATMTTRIERFESSIDSLTSQRDTAMSRLTEILAGIDDNDRILNSLTLERDGLVSNVEECRGAIARLEAEKVDAASKMSGLQDTVNTLQGQVERLSAMLNAAEAKDESARKQVADLTSQVSDLTAERDKSATRVEEFKSELSILQSTLDCVKAERDAALTRAEEILSRDSHTKQMVEVLNSEKNGLTTQIEECIKRLYAENDKSTEPITGLDVPSMKSNDSMSTIERLQDQLREKDVQISKLMRDKEKLEAYTKQTLLIFQQKYFSTTQDFKAQLKTKTQKIHALENELRGG
ncbi:hypothetical protein ACHAXA_010454 [Cyclostephanos tholiformis]|uniref:Uncharacterized protein n=1 Tax=Cyclostephanos tholiformis TaxID=382380 RepID=A0ABD3SFL5_9STRA